MEVKLYNGPQRMLDFMKNYLTCSLCGVLFDQFTHMPRYLPCKHFICEACLSTKGRLPSFTCPKCVIEEDISRITHDRARQMCGISSCGMYPGLIYCKECHFCLCEWCVEHHIHDIVYLQQSTRTEGR